MRQPFPLRDAILCIASILTIACSTAHAAPPVGYYATVDDSSANALRATLHPVIDDHLRYPYSSSGTDTWVILEDAQDFGDPSHVIDVYRNRRFPKFGGGNSSYSREHSWPSSYGFPNNVSSNYPYTDCHHLFLSDDGYNSTRGNKRYQSCSSCTEVLTDANDGEGGASSGYPGWSNWTQGQSSSGTWETWVGRRGDVARAVLYMDIRYEGGVHGVTGGVEPDLRLTDDASLISTGSPNMGMLTDILRWNIDDPVSATEQSRNEVVFGYQHNRNPFIDHPEWAGCLHRGACPSTPLALAPNDLVAVAGNAAVDLEWSDSTQSIVVGFRIYRATAAGGPWSVVTPQLQVTSAYHDGGALGATEVHYRVCTVDAAGRESSPCAETQILPGLPGDGGPVAINEVHYDNDGADSGEGVEISGPAGLDLSGWRIVAYNGSGGAAYGTVFLSGILPAQQQCSGTLAFSFVGLQNGAPDGLALVDASSNVVQFISYEGTLLATDGPAAGQTSVDIGVSESASPVGESLQRVGTDGARSPFVATAPSSFGQVNPGQAFDGCSSAE